MGRYTQPTNTNINKLCSYDVLRNVRKSCEKNNSTPQIILNI